MTESFQFDDILARLPELIVGLSADAILAADGGGTIRSWNPGATRIFGYTAEEAIGASLDIIIPERLRDRHCGLGPCHGFRFDAIRRR